jgi:acetyltransferase-like isoleucine patch superfamily enzyme
VEIKLIEVNRNIDNHIRILYILLSKRIYNISHFKLPNYSEHKRFVINSPYRIWYLIKKHQEFIGSVYITNENVISINGEKIGIEDYKVILKNVLDNHDPLKPIKSVRNANFLINVNPLNKVLIEFMKRTGMEHIQSSFLIKPKKIDLLIANNSQTN